MTLGLSSRVGGNSARVSGAVLEFEPDAEALALFARAARCAPAIGEAGDEEQPSASALWLQSAEHCGIEPAPGVGDLDPKAALGGDDP